MNVSRPTTASVQALLEQHRQIEQIIGEIKEAILNHTTDCCAIAEKTKFLCRLLADHFRYEEEGGYFSEAVLVAPHLVERAKALESEHQSILDLLQSYCHKTCADGVDPQVWWATAKEAFLEFEKAIARHEHEENLLIQEAFLSDFGTKD